MRYCFLRFPNGLAKAVTLSYDDGPKFDKIHSDILGKYGLKCTYNINSGSLANGGDEWHLTRDEISEYILDRGHEVAVHGKHHIAPGATYAAAGIRDVLTCRMELEGMFGKIIRGMAYPDTGIVHLHNGMTYETIKRYLADLGIAYARSLGGDNNSFKLPGDWYNWVPTAHHANPELMNYIDQFVACDVSSLYCTLHYPRLFYLWGHSYEFHNNNNWELLETIGEKLGNKDDTWYATNMEIYEYVTAYRSLIFSADNTICYNPTTTTVWFEGDGRLYTVLPGETKAL